MVGYLSVIIAAAVAFFIAILSGLGVGSGGLFVIWLVGAYGVSAPQARGMNLLFFVFSASAAFIFHYKNRGISLRTVAVLAVFSLLGTVIGTEVAQYVDATLLRKIFGVFLIASGAYSLFGKAFAKNIKKISKTPLQNLFYMI